MLGLRIPFLTACVALSTVAHAQTPLASPSPEAFGRFGEAVSSLGDADGDGIRDVLVGAPGETAGGVASAGRVHLISGATFATIRTIESPTPTAGGAFGFAVASAGDLDRDGVTDAVVGAPGETVDGQTRAGRAYVLSGADGSVLLSMVSDDVWQDGEFGFDVARVGDRDGDGTNDYIIGSPGSLGASSNPAGADAGAIYIYSGATGGLLYAGYALNAGARFGTRVRGGDFDGNGRAGHVASAPRQESGRVDQYSDSSFLGILRPPSSFSEFGQALDVIGDRDGLGVADFVVGAKEGVLVYAGTDRSLLLTIPSPDGPGDDFGFAVAGAGNVNEAGVADLIVGAPLAALGGVAESGRVFVHSGDDGALLYARTSPNRVVNGRFGHAVALAGDVDDDNTADQIVGAPGETVDGFVGAGRAYLLLSSVVVASGEAPQTDLALAAWPNPARGTLHVEFDASPEAHVVVLDALGREVSRATAASGDAQFETSAWAPGVYLVRLVDGATVQTATVTVVR